MLTSQHRNEGLYNCSIFLECADKAGVLEWDAQSDKFVTLHEGVVGTVSGPPTGDRVLVTNYDNSSAAIFATGGPSAGNPMHARIREPKIGFCTIKNLSILGPSLTSGKSAAKLALDTRKASRPIQVSEVTSCSITASFRVEHG